MTNTRQTLPELTREQVATTLVRPLEQASTFLSLGATIYDTAGPLRLPFVPVYPDTPVAMTGEAEPIPTLSADTRELQMLPSTMKSFKLIDRYSNELARASFVNLDAVLRSSLIAKVAALVDEQLLGTTGDGVTAPKGLGAYAGVQELPVGGPLTIQHVLDAHGLMLEADAKTEGLTLLMRPSDYMVIRSHQDPIGGGYVVVPDVQRGGLVVPLLGAKVVMSKRIAEGTAYLLDPKAIAVARDVESKVRVLGELYQATGEVGISIETRLDAIPVVPDAIVRFTGITAAP